MINIGKKHRKILLEGKKKKKNSNSKIKFYTTKKQKIHFIKKYDKKEHYMKKINKRTICIILLIGIIILSNLVWGYIYFREKNNLRRSLIPLAKGDYYQARLTLVDNFENSKEYEYKENIWVIDDIKTDVPFISQLPDYPNGCEAVSAVMLLKKYGVDITIDEFVSKYLKKDNIYSVDGERYGPNPKDTYAGDPSSLTGGFGVFSVGIKDAIDKVLN